MVEELPVVFKDEWVRYLNLAENNRLYDVFALLKELQVKQSHSIQCLAADLKFSDSSTSTVMWLPTARVKRKDSAYFVRYGDDVYDFEKEVSSIEFFYPSPGIEWTPIQFLNDQTAVPWSTGLFVGITMIEGVFSAGLSNSFESVSDFIKESNRYLKSTLARKRRWLDRVRVKWDLSESSAFVADLDAVDSVKRPEGSYILIADVKLNGERCFFRPDFTRLQVQFEREFFDRDIVEMKAPSILLDYLFKIALNWEKLREMKQYGHCTVLAQSSAVGKSRSATECLNFFPGWYSVFREPHSTGFPTTNPWSKSLLAILSKGITSRTTEFEKEHYVLKWMATAMLTMAYSLKRSSLKDFAKEMIKGSAAVSKVFCSFAPAVFSTTDLVYKTDSEERADLSLAIDDDFKFFVERTVLNGSLDPEVKTDMAKLVAFIGRIADYILENCKVYNESKLILFVFDEVGLLTEAFHQEISIPFIYIRRALSRLVDVNVFGLFLGTSIVPRKVYNEKYMLYYQETDMKVLPPIVYDNYFDIGKEAGVVYEGSELAKMLDPESSPSDLNRYFEHLAHLGRPYWQSLLDKHGHEFILMAALEKLMFKERYDKEIMSARWITAFASMAGLSITPESRLASLLVRSLMAWLVDLNPETYAATCVYYSEPVLALAAGAGMFNCGTGENNIDREFGICWLFRPLKEYILSGEVCGGDIDEGICRWILLAAMFKGYSFAKKVPRLNFVDFLENLYGYVWGFTDKMRRFQDELRKRIGNVFVSFSHFIPLEADLLHTSINTEMLLCGLNRNAGFILPRGFAAIDALIPCVISKDASAADGSARLGYIGLQFKNCISRYMEAPISLFDEMSDKMSREEGVVNVANLAIVVGSEDSMTVSETFKECSPFEKDQENQSQTWDLHSKSFKIRLDMKGGTLSMATLGLGVFENLLGRSSLDEIDGLLMNHYSLARMLQRSDAINRDKAYYTAKFPHYNRRRSLYGTTEPQPVESRLKLKFKFTKRELSSAAYSSLAPAQPKSDSPTSSAGSLLAQRHGEASGDLVSSEREPEAEADGLSDSEDPEPKKLKS